MPEASQDPTFQSAGVLEIGLKMDMNVTVINTASQVVSGMPFSFGSIVNSPPDAPGPPWTQPAQYTAVNGQVAGFGAMLTLMPPWVAQFGMVEPIVIADMSSATVITGKTYAVTVNVGQFWIQLYFVITGVAGGSTVLPGFGLWNLGTNPNAWTYVTPTAFTGEWEIGLHTPLAFTPVWLAVEYAPHKVYGVPPAEARLTFTVSGTNLSQPLPATETAGDGPPPYAERPTGPQYLHDRSDPYIIVPGP